MAEIRLSRIKSSAFKISSYAGPSVITYYRLLKEMGWNETDDEEYVITEDDMKEFQNLTKQVDFSLLKYN